MFCYLGLYVHIPQHFFLYAIKVQNRRHHSETGWQGCEHLRQGYGQHYLFSIKHFLITLELTNLNYMIDGKGYFWIRTYFTIIIDNSQFITVWLFKMGTPIILASLILGFKMATLIILDLRFYYSNNNYPWSSVLMK